jgi:hypothetical protein
MTTLVLALGSLDVAEGAAEGLVAVRPDGTIDLAVEGSLADAAKRLARRLEPDVACEERLAFLGRPFGWRPRALARNEQVFRASLALTIASQLPPTWHDDLARLVEAWCAFWPLALWNEVPAEMAFPLVRTTKGRITTPAVSLLGQSRREFGAAVYDDLDDFDSLFDRGVMRGKNRSVLAAPGELPVAFDPLDVPCPVIVTSSGMKPRKPSRDDVLLLTGALEVLVGVLSRKVEIVLGPDDTLRLKTNADRAPPTRRPGKTSSRPKKPRAR